MVKTLATKEPRTPDVGGSLTKRGNDLGARLDPDIIRVRFQQNASHGIYALGENANSDLIGLRVGSPFGDSIHVPEDRGYLLGCLQQMRQVYRKWMTRNVSGASTSSRKAAA